MTETATILSTTGGGKVARIHLTGENTPHLAIAADSLIKTGDAKEVTLNIYFEKEKASKVIEVLTVLGVEPEYRYPG